MGQSEGGEALAPKVFFIDPDLSIVTEEFLESAFLQGYEVYSVSERFCGELQQKVDLLVSTYHDLFLYFSIDRKNSFSTWATFLRSVHLKEQNRERVRMGVLFSETKAEQFGLAPGSSASEVLGLNAGCVILPVSIGRSQTALLEGLRDNNASGRRTVIRCHCSADCRFTFEVKGKRIQLPLLDLSVSHFSVSAAAGGPDWDVGTKLSRAQLKVWGNILTVDAVLVLKRSAGSSTTLVFCFQSEDGRLGLEDSLLRKVNRIIFNRHQALTHQMLETKLGICSD